VSELPAGRVTFLFTDIERSTRLLQELGDDYASVLTEHRRVHREAFTRCGGVEVDTHPFFLTGADGKTAWLRACGAPEHGGAMCA
jgi:class 3 adenylate cyclase